MKSLPLLLLLLLASADLFAQQKKQDRSLLWEISGKGLKHPSYLYGTFHVEDRRVFDFTDSVLLKFHECTTFASEIVLDSAVREVFRRALEKNADTMQSPTVEENDAPMSDDVAEPGDHPDDSIAVATDSPPLAPPDPSGWNSSPEPLGVPNAPEESDPSYAAGGDEPDESYAPKHSSFDTDLFKTQRARRRPGDRPVFLDAYLYQLAKQEGKKIIGLERVSEQLDLDEPSVADFWKFYFQKKKGRRRIFGGREDSQEEMIRYYHEGDLNQLLAIMRESFPPDYFKRLLTDRNHNMADRAVHYMEEGPTFIAVGAGHLPGREGVIQLLRRKGYTVRPVGTPRTGLAAKYQPPTPRENWVGFAPPEGGFSVELPLEPIDISLLAQGSDDDSDGAPRAESTLYGWPDIGTGIEYFVGYTDYQEIPDIETQEDFTGWVKSIYADGSQKILDSVRTVYAEGLRGSEVETDEDDSRQRTRYFLRGERLYRLKVLTVPEQINSDRVERFFNSFHLDPPSPIAWSDFTSSDGEFTARFPGAPKISTSGSYRPDMGNGTIFSAVDKYSGAFYRVERFDFSNYYQNSSIDSVLIDAVGDRNYGTVASRRIFRLDGAPAMDVEYSVTGSAVRRERMMVRGGKLYRVSTSLDRHGDTTAAATFIDSFRATGDTASAGLLSDKTAILLRDIGSSDGEKHQAALAAAREHDFPKESLPEIHALLRRSYSDDGREYVGTRNVLFGVLAKLRDTSSVSVVRDIYSTLPANPDLRSSALSVLASIGTERSLNLFLDLLAGDPAVAKSSASLLFYPLADSIRSVAPIIFPRIFSLLDTREFRAPIYTLTVAALDSGALAPADIVPQKHAFLWDGIGLLMLRRDLKQDDADYAGNTDQLRLVAELLGYFPGDSEVTMFLRKLVVDRDRDVALSSAVALLRLREPVPPELLEHIADDDFWRVPLYRALAGIDRLDVFPEKYRSQRSIAGSMLTEWVMYDQEDGGEIDSMVVIDERMVTHNGETGRAFLFKFHFAGASDSSRWYVGISGLQPKSTDRISTSGQLLGSRYELLESKSIDEHYKALLDDGVK